MCMLMQSVCFLNVEGHKDKPMRKIVKLGMKVFKENLNQKSLFQNFQGKKSHKGFKTSFSVSIIHKVSNFSYKISTKIPIVI